MIGNERNFSLSLWDHKDNFICLLKSSNSSIDGQTYNEYFSENINGEKTLSFSIPMYVFNLEAEEGHNFEKNKILWEYKDNILWQYIKNEQKIRYTEYDDILNKPIRIEEFVLKEFTEERNGEEKIANCTCESLAVYELGKVGWNISFDIDYITDYESNSTFNPNYNELQTLDYWLKKIFYKETNLGRVSNTTECTYLLQGLQLRDNEGYPIDQDYDTIKVETSDIEQYTHKRIAEPECSSTIDEEYIKYYNPTGWYWEVQAKFENDPEKQSTTTLYEKPTINKYIEKIPNYYEAQSYQKGINSNSTEPIQLRKYPIPEEELDSWTYVTDIKKRLFNVERSNIFSIIQDLCEIFEIWAYFQYSYSEEGKITERKILFKTESIDEDIKFDFAYGKNLQSCSRIINSNDLITKLIVPPVESNLGTGNLLSIQQATANPTGENYIYNFDYFYDIGTLTREESFPVSQSNISDEYKINFHSGKLREINNKILDLQKFLLPLYDKQNELESELTVQEAAKTGLMDNIQSIQDKVDAIPPNEQLIKSWSDDSNQNNHIGTIKTYTVTTSIFQNETSNCFYLNFGRDDVIVATTDIYQYEFKDGNVIGLTTPVYSITTTCTPKSAIINWRKGTEIPEGTSTEDESFVPFIYNIANCIYDYSELGNKTYIKGIYFKEDRGTYGRIRYKYAPLAYYYLLIKDYWVKISEVQKKIDELKEKILEVKNKIFIYDLDLKKALNTKQELILQFEKDYKPFIREGYWEPTDYQAQIETINLETGTIPNSEKFNGLFCVTTNLIDLNLNDSLSTYSYYFSLPNSDNIDINSIEMKTQVVTKSGDDTMTTWIPRYRGHDFEIYRDAKTANQLIIGIAPELITYYDKYDYGYDTGNKYPKKCDLIYKELESEETKQKKDITWISTNIDQVQISDWYIYLNNDNILTDSLKIGGNIDSTTTIIINGEESVTTISPFVELELYTDYTYNFDSTVYTTTGIRVDINKYDFSSATTGQDLYYDYSLKIPLKITNKVNKIINQALEKSEKPNFKIQYIEESTLQYLYNDSDSTAKKYGIPQVEYTIGIVDLSSLNKYKNYKPKVGQKVPIFDEEMGLINYEGFITSISYNLEQKEDTEITIATYSSKFEDVFQKLTAVMTDVSYNQNKITNAVESFETDGSIKTEVFQKSLQDNFNRVELGVNNDITIDKVTGITLKDLDTKNGIKLIGNGIFLTQNIDADEVQWRTGITGEGINADVLRAGNIDTKQINIWNSSEGQIRFRWNEEGLMAYGDTLEPTTSTSTSVITLDDGTTTSILISDDILKTIDYKKFVKFNQNGLNFSDGGKSALALDWEGLKINAQNDSLNIDANKGLTIIHWDNDKNSSTTRLQLGKFSENLYGLKLFNDEGQPTFQNDSDGNLWLSRLIKVGGEFGTTTYTSTPNAGVSGIEENTPNEYQMGPKRDQHGDFMWESNPLRFWAGPRSINEYNEDEETSITTIFSSRFPNNVDPDEKFPSLSRFKVDSGGNIVASGIDVGGWIGGGSFLRSKDYEAILKSGNYESTSEIPYEKPVLAIGKFLKVNKEIPEGTNYYLYDNGLSTQAGVLENKYKFNGDWKYSEDILDNILPVYKINDSETTYVFNPDELRIYKDEDIPFYNFKVYRNGAISVGPTNSFIVYPSGRVEAKELTISGQSSFSTEGFKTDDNGAYVRSGEIAGFNVSSTSLVFTNGNYQTKIQTLPNSTDIAFSAGALNSPSFKVTNEGKLTANSGNIGGWEIDGTNGIRKISGNYGTFMKPNTNNSDPVLLIGTSTNIYANSANTNFAVTGQGDVYFKHGIYGWSNTNGGSFKKGLEATNVKLYTEGGGALSVEVCQGLIIDMS